MPLQRKLNKQGILSVTKGPSSSSSSCLSSTIDCTTDILDLNGSKAEKGALNDCLLWACECPTEAGFQKLFPEAASSFQKHPPDTEAVGSKRDDRF